MGCVFALMSRSMLIQSFSFSVKVFHWQPEVYVVYFLFSSLSHVFFASFYPLLSFLFAYPIASQSNCSFLSDLLLQPSFYSNIFLPFPSFTFDHLSFPPYSLLKCSWYHFFPPSCPPPPVSISLLSYSYLSVCLSLGRAGGSSDIWAAGKQMHVFKSKNQKIWAIMGVRTLHLSSISILFHRHWLITLSAFTFFGFRLCSTCGCYHILITNSCEIMGWQMSALHMNREVSHYQSWISSSNLRRHLHLFSSATHLSAYIIFSREWMAGTGS